MVRVPDGPNTNSPVLLFHYPSLQPAGFDYLKRSVKLEFGSLTDQQPVGRHPVRPWTADVLPDAFPDWRCEVVALEVERSFWEKATILHAEYHRPAEKTTPDRFSRHCSAWYVGKTPEREAEVAGLRLKPGSSRADYLAALEHQKHGESVHPPEEVCSREMMRTPGRQPQILLTNVKQLELLLTRQQDVSLFADARDIIEIAVSDLHDEGAMQRHFRRLAGFLRADDLKARAS